MIRAPEEGFVIQRAEMLSLLREDPRPDLVFVQYGPAHNVLREWVYNHPDLESAPVVWAREMGEDRRALLAESYPERNLWLLTVDSTVTIERFHPDSVGLMDGAQSGGEERITLPHFIKEPAPPEKLR